MSESKCIHDMRTCGCAYCEGWLHELSEKYPWFAAANLSPEREK